MSAEGHRAAPRSRDRLGLAGLCAILPFFFDQGSPFMDDAVTALAYVVMALGLNIVVGLRGPARPRLRGVLRDRRVHDRVAGLRLRRQGQRRQGHPHRRQRLRREPARHPPQLPARARRRRHHHGDCGRADRLAHPAPAGRLHRDRHARLRRDHPGDRAERQRDHVLRLRARQTARKGITPVDKIDLPFTRAFGSLDLQTLVLDRARPGGAGPVRELPAARLAPRPGLDRGPRGRGGRGEHGRAAGADEAARLRDRGRVRRDVRRVPRVVPEHGERRPVPVRVLDLHPRDDHPRRAREHLGCRPRGGGALVREHVPDPRRAQRAAVEGRARLRPDRAQLRHLRVPARDHDGASARGPPAGAPAQARARWRRGRANRSGSANPNTIVREPRA